MQVGGGAGKLVTRLVEPPFGGQGRGFAVVAAWAVVVVDAGAVVVVVGWVVDVAFSAAFFVVGRETR